MTLTQRMRRLPWVLLKLLVLLSACTTRPTTVEVSPIETLGLIRNEFGILIDLREAPAVRTQGRPAPAVWIPASQIQDQSPVWKDLLASTPKSKQLVFCCGTPEQMAQAAQEANRAGFRAGLMGSFESWKEAALPVQAGPPETPTAPTQR